MVQYQDGKNIITHYLYITSLLCNKFAQIILSKTNNYPYSHQYIYEILCYSLGQFE